MFNVYLLSTIYTPKGIEVILYKKNPQIMAFSTLYQLYSDIFVIEETNIIKENHPKWADIRCHIKLYPVHQTSGGYRTHKHIGPCNN